ncbi:hypothetical protein Avbf_17221 [Armadillidium vulgare]|nr:hypothetical protein Avbf_17221 [Armadillidium vulgare]
MKIRKFCPIFLVTILIGASYAQIPRENNNNLPNGNGNGKGINDGHRLITRALWRIFDALMEKKNHEELYGRMKFVESTLKDVITSDSKVDGQIGKIMDTVNGYKDELSQLKKEVDKIKGIETRIREIEEWQLRLERQKDDGDASPIGVYAQPGFSACPPPFEAVGGECIYVAMEQKRGWRDARRECARIGGDLAAPRDFEALRNYLRNLPNDQLRIHLVVDRAQSDIYNGNRKSGRPTDGHEPKHVE